MKRIILFPLLCLFPLLSDAQNYKLGKSKDGVEELYIMSVTSNPSAHTMIASDRVKPMPGKLQDFREQAKSNADKKVDTKGLEKLGFYKRKVQFSTTQMAYRILEIAYYELSGKEIEMANFDEETLKWHRIPAESLLEAEYHKVTGK